MPDVVELDAFDLCDWLGDTEVTWAPAGSIRSGHLVAGTLSAGGRNRACDLLAVDEAYPRAVLQEAWRTRTHREWTHDQVLLLLVGDRLTAAVPGTGFTADRVLEVVARLARAVGAPPERFTVALRP